MNHNHDTLEIPQKALNELKELLFLEMGENAKLYNENDLKKLGTFLLNLLALSYKYRLRIKNESNVD